jgi:rod shape-determining protein MreD
MIPAIAAVGAIVAAILEGTVWPYLVIAGAHPHVVFVYVVILAAVLGLDAGLAAAFVGGLALDLITFRPIGSSAFALLVCAGLAVALSRGAGRVRLLAPIVAAFVLSFVYSMTVAALFSALAGPVALRDPVGELLPGAVYDAVMAAAVGPLAIAFRLRRLEQDRVDW